MSVVNILHKIGVMKMNNKDEVRMDYEAECKRLQDIIGKIESRYDEEKSRLHYRISELEQELMIYEQKWSVIELIFGK